MKSGIKLLAILTIATVLLLQGCGSNATSASSEDTLHNTPTETKVRSQYAQSPQEALDMFFEAFEKWDRQILLDAHGIEYLPEDCHFYFDIEECHPGYHFSYSKLKIEKSVGDQFEEDLERISTYWLNDVSIPIEMVYDVFDIINIGLLSFTYVEEIDSEVTEEEEMELTVVETQYGWFIVGDK